MNDLAPAPLPDYRLLFEAAPDLYLVLTPDLMIAGASDAFYRATRTERAAILGRHLFDAMPDNPEDTIAVAGTAVLRASFARVLQSRRPDKMPTVKFDVRADPAEGGGFEERGEKVGGVAKGVWNAGKLGERGVVWGGVVVMDHGRSSLEPAPR